MLLYALRFIDRLQQIHDVINLMNGFDDFPKWMVLRRYNGQYKTRFDDDPQRLQRPLCHYDDLL